MSETHPALLPNGLKDLLPPEAEQEASIINQLLENFSKFGYRQVKPPLVEFEESLMAGTGKALARNTFRLMDPVSQRMMGLRADTTAQIVRIAQSRLKDEKRPLRLSYASDVLRVNGSQLRPERQFCQVGCELIGAGDAKDDVEIALAALEALDAAGIEDMSIDLTIPTLIDTLFEAFKVESVERGQIEGLIHKRDRDGLRGMKSKMAECLVDLLDSSGVAENAITGLKKIKMPKEAQEHIKTLTAFYDGLVEALAAFGQTANITIDLIEWRGFQYLNGVSFTIFAPQVRGELGRGGRYHISDTEDVTGFTLYMDSVRQAASAPEEKQRKTVKASTTWQEIRTLQEQGFLVTREK